MKLAILTFISLYWIGFGIYTWSMVNRRVSQRKLSADFLALFFCLAFGPVAYHVWKQGEQ